MIVKNKNLQSFMNSEQIIFMESLPPSIENILYSCCLPQKREDDNIQIFLWI